MNNSKSPSKGKPAWLVGCGALLAAAALVVLVCAGGLDGVPVGTRTFRIVFEDGAPPEGRPILEETWHTDAPWHGGLLSTSTFQLDGDATLEGNAIVGRVAHRRWAFFEQRLEEIVLGVTRGGSEREVLHFGSAADPNASPDLCASAAGGEIARLRLYAASPPLCILYPETASEIEVTVDSRAIDSVFLQSRGRTTRGSLEDDLPLVVGETQEFHVAGQRIVGLNGGVAAFDARLESVVVPEALWQELRGAESSPDVFTAEAWQTLVTRARAAPNDGWYLSLHAGELSVTAPREPGSRVRVLVIGFAEGDELASCHPVPMIAVAAGDRPASTDDEDDEDDEDDDDL